MRVGLLSSLVLLVAGCSKPSPAMQAAEQYGETGTRSTALEAFTVEPVEVSYLINDSPSVSAGQFNVCQEVNGALEWSKAKALSEEKVGGDRVVDVEVAICMRPENGACNRPNLYALKALMRETGGQWKVAGSTCVIKNRVR